MSEFQSFGSLFAFSEKKQMFVDLDGTLWVNADLACKELGFANTARSVAAYTDEDEREKINVGALNDAWFVSESGLWSLILASKSEKAKQFKKVLAKQILPNIRKNGFYIDPSATKPQLEAMQKEILHHTNWTVDQFLETLDEDQADRRLQWEDF